MNNLKKTAAKKKLFYEALCLFLGLCLCVPLCALYAFVAELMLPNREDVGGIQTRLV